MTRKTPEGRFKAEFTRDLEDLYPGCVILKNDEQLFQGIPDMLFLYEDFWAMFEVKKDAAAARQPNQAYYIEKFDKMSFAAFVYPENKEDVLHDLQQSLQSRGTARLPKR